MLTSVALLAAGLFCVGIAVQGVVGHFHYTEYSETEGAFDKFDPVRSLKYYGPDAAVPAAFGALLLWTGLRLRPRR